MKSNGIRFSFILFTFLAGAIVLNAQYPQHSIHANINHSTKEITVTDTIQFPAELISHSRVLEFSLNSHLNLDKTGEGFRIEQTGAVDGEETTHYHLMLTSNSNRKVTIPITYSGKIDVAIESGAAEYARGFSTTEGIITDEGIYLAGSSGWIPSFEISNLFTFNLTAGLDEAWSMVSQGTRTINKMAGHRHIVQYDSPDPVDEVYLIAGKWTEYSTQSGKVLIQAFLRTPDEELANRYLGVTSSYLAMYKDLIGEYPYSKFALVENFWETGFGMPSFTLLGEQVIRFPWILHSSYPHELLHNYWGNSVYVEITQGNWCEGITAYMADHLIKEQQGQGDDYRRTTLQKFTDYVNPENDFPPSGFTSRNNPAEEAIGYGKVLMFNDMLRESFGDTLFRMAYADFYNRFRFRFASWDDIRSSFERVTGRDLQSMFDQWIKRKGAPSLRLSDVKAKASEMGYELTFSLRQVQDEESFSLNIPVAVYLEGMKEVYVTKIPMDTREKTISLHFENRPLKISIDPQFHLMRRLHYSEVPSSLSQLFGAERSAIILPGKSEHIDQYKKLAETWMASQAVQGKKLEILYDSDLQEIPAGLSVWVVGFENSFYEGIRINDLYQDVLSNEEQSVIQQLSKNNSLVYAIPNPHAPGKTIGFIGTHFPGDIDVLARKLPHYGSYGYLGFEGGEFTNVLKGGLPVLNSALDQRIPWSDNPSIPQKLRSRKALAYTAGE